MIKDNDIYVVVTHKQNLNPYFVITDSSNTKFFRWADGHFEFCYSYLQALKKESITDKELLKALGYARTLDENSKIAIIHSTLSAVHVNEKDLKINFIQNLLKEKFSPKELEIFQEVFGNNTYPLS